MGYLSKAFVMYPITDENLNVSLEKAIGYLDDDDVHDSVKSYYPKVTWVEESSMEDVYEAFRNYIPVDITQVDLGDKRTGYVINATDLIPILRNEIDQAISKSLKHIEMYQQSRDPLQLRNAYNWLDDPDYLFIVRDMEYFGVDVFDNVDLLYYILNNNVKSLVLYQGFDLYQD